MNVESNLEIELKFEVANRHAADAYLGSANLGAFSAAGPVRSSQVEDRYVDSRDWALSRAGFAARLRRTAKGTRINLKTHAGGGSGMHRREELDGPADLARAPVEWPASAARSVVLELCGDAPLVEVLTIRQLRRVRQLEAGRTRAELSLDDVEVIGDGRVLERFEELEVELKGGDEAPLRDLAPELAGDPNLRPADESKLDRGVRALLTALPSMRDDLQTRWLEAPPELVAVAARRAGEAVQATAHAGDGAPARRTREVARAADAPPTAPWVEATPGGDLEVAGELDVAAGEAGPASDPGEGGPKRAARKHPRGRSKAARAADAKAADAKAADAKASGAKGARRPDEERGTGRSAGVSADDSLADAARKILRFQFGRLRANEAETRAGGVDALHDMRVASRRMRAAWRIFGDAYKRDRTRDLRRALRPLAFRLGAVRDLDVLIEGVEAYGADLPPEERAGLNPLVELWRRQREAARGLLVDELESGGYRRFVEEMELFVGSGAGTIAIAAPTVPHRVRDRAPSRIWDAYEQVRGFEAVVPWAAVETLHELRIAGKWLRYSLEFFGEALGGEAPALVERVTELQDHLGALHDADVAAKLVRDVLISEAGQLSPAETAAIATYLESREREIARRRRGFTPVWRGVVSSQFRRSLGRAVATL